MGLALAEAEAAARRGEVPVGAVLLDGATGAVLARAGNRVEQLREPTAHAEMLVIRTALALLGAEKSAPSNLPPRPSPVAGEGKGGGWTGRSAQAGEHRWLEGCDLYVTLEPCAMCAAAIALARIRRLYFAAYDPKGGGVEHGARIFAQPTCNHRPEVYGGIGESAAADLLRRFFQQRR